MKRAVVTVYKSLWRKQNVPEKCETTLESGISTRGFRKK
jgi:hypothetical protein